MPSQSPRVLIVDQSEDTREVLEFALGRRGWANRTCATLSAGLAAAKESRPDVMVIDVDCIDDENVASRDAVVISARASADSLVLVGNETPHMRQNDDPNDVRVAKPYHYASLVNKIEEVLSEVGQNPTQDLAGPIESNSYGLRRAA